MVIVNKSKTTKKSKSTKKDDIFYDFFPNIILQNFPIKSLKRCFTKHKMEYTKKMNIDEIILTYKKWRSKEAFRRKILRDSHKKTIINKKNNFMNVFDDNYDKIEYYYIYNDDFNNTDDFNNNNDFFNNFK
jgi:hypothetical protein